MSGLDNLRKRLNYYGATPEERFKNDKLRTLKKALIYSYQGETIINSKGQEFRCLINSDKTKDDYDIKTISIPFEDIVLNAERVGKTSEGQVENLLSAGEVFTWKGDEKDHRPDTDWLITLRHLNENAYFRAVIRKCNTSVEINGHKYRVPFRGPVETTIPENQKDGKIWNNMNYSAIMYITRNEETTEYFKRFTKIKIDGSPWKVKAKNLYNDDSAVIEIALGEEFNNTMEDAMIIEKDTYIDQVVDGKLTYIEGPTHVKPYDIVTYTLANGDENATPAWSVDNDKAQILSQNKNTIKVEILSSKRGSFKLTCDDSSLDIKIDSL